MNSQFCTFVRIPLQCINEFWKLGLIFFYKSQCFVAELPSFRNSARVSKYFLSTRFEFQTQSQIQACIVLDDAETRRNLAQRQRLQMDQRRHGIRREIRFLGIRLFDDFFGKVERFLDFESQYLDIESIILMSDDSQRSTIIELAEEKCDRVDGELFLHWQRFLLDIPNVFGMDFIDSRLDRMLNFQIRRSFSVILDH